MSYQRGKTQDYKLLDSICLFISLAEAEFLNFTSQVDLASMR